MTFVALLGAAVDAVTQGTSFERTITLGSLIVGLLLAVATLVGVFYGVRYKVSYETASARAGQLSDWLDEALEREKRVEGRLLESLRKLEDMALQLAECQATIARLEALPNVQAVVEKMGELAVQQDAAAAQRLEQALLLVGDRFERLETTTSGQIAAHEDRAAERGERIVSTLETIAGSLESAADRLATTPPLKPSD
jgi:hypothetical protein